MLADVIVKRWREVSSVQEHVQVLTPEEVGAARAFFERLTALTSDEARSQLAQGDATQNRNLAWVLLDAALARDIFTDAEHTLNLVDWAEFVAQYGDALENRQDALKAHCEFFRGVLKHGAGHLAEAQLSYARAEKDYRDVSASLLLQGLAVYAQGAAAHEADNIEGNLKAFSAGSRERFQQALEILRRTGPQTVADEVQALIDHAMRQWELVNELLATDQPTLILDERHELVDLDLAKLLQGRTRVLAVNESPVSEAVAAARLADTVSGQLDQTTDFVDQLLAYYIRSKRLGAAEFILREQLATRPDDDKLQETLAYVLFQQAKYVEVRPLLEDVLKHDPDNATMSMILGMTLLELDDPANASTYLQRTLALDPNNTLAAQALQQTQTRQQIDPPTQFDFQDGALTIYGGGNLSSNDLAAGMTAAVLAENPDRIEAELARVAESDLELARRVAALLQEQGLLEAQPQQSAPQHYERAERFFSQARWQEAKDAYRLAVEADPNFAKAFMGWGDVHYRLGEYYLAIAYFEESLAIEPNPYAYRYLGDARQMIGKPKQAVEAYKQALKLDSNYAGARESLQELVKRGVEDEEAAASN